MSNENRGVVSSSSWYCIWWKKDQEHVVYMHCIPQLVHVLTTADAVLPHIKEPNTARTNIYMHAMPIVMRSSVPARVHNARATAPGYAMQPAVTFSDARSGSKASTATLAAAAAIAFVFVLAIASEGGGLSRKESKPICSDVECNMHASQNH